MKEKRFFRFACLLLILSLSCAATQAQIGVTEEQLISRLRDGKSFKATEQTVRSGEYAYLPGGEIYLPHANHGDGIALEYSLEEKGLVRFEQWQSYDAFAPADILKLSEPGYAWTRAEPQNWFGTAPGQPPLHAWYHDDASSNHYLYIASLAAAPDKGKGGQELLELQEQILGAVPADDKRFFSGAHLGLRMQDCLAYYRKLGNVTVQWSSDAPAGQAKVDLRTTKFPQRSVEVYYDRGDHKILSVSYGKRGHGETLSKTERQYLKSLNSGHDIKIDDQGWVLEVITPKQYRIEQEEIWLDPVEIGKHLITTIPQLGERGKEITVTYCGAVSNRAALDRLGLEPRDAAIRYAYYVRNSGDIFVFVLIPGEKKPRWIEL
jgi:hypothetical protein